MADLNYSTQEILQQQFKTKMRGYDPEEVDEYLDNIIRDYEAMQKEILNLKEENEHLQAQVEKLKKMPVSTPRATAGEDSTKSAQVTNFDILKRLSNLEREVFGSKLDGGAKSSSNFSSNLAQRVQEELPKVAPRRTFIEPEVDPDATRLF